MHKFTVIVGHCKQTFNVTVCVLRLHNVILPDIIIASVRHLPVYCMYTVQVLVPVNNDTCIFKT